MRNLKNLRVKDLHFALAASVILHLCAVLLFAALLSGPRRLVETVAADLTFISGPENPANNPGGPGSKGPGARKAGSGTKHGHPAASPANSPIPAKTESPGQVTAQTLSPQAYPVEPVRIHGERPGVGGKEGQDGGYFAGTSGGAGIHAAGGGRGNGGPDTGGTTGEGIKGGSDYYYIRDMVMKNIKYPERARRMGAEGTVLLSFIVLESGVTREVKVIDGSGFRLLDESAKEGVEKTVIQKKVPYRVMVTLPITYRLQ